MKQALAFLSVLLAGAPLLAQCGSAELARMNHLASAFQNDVTMLDSLSPDEIHAFRTMAHDCTLAITTRAQREGKSDFHDLSKDDLILLYWISVMDDTASTVQNLHSAQKCQKPDTLDQQGKCAVQARKDFEDWSYSAKYNADFVSHYSPTLDRCFVQFQYSIMNTGWFYRQLFDAFGGKMYADYAWRAEKDKKYWEVAPAWCTVTLPSGDKRTCHSDEEFLDMVKVYMER